ncbi:hypothetical protein DB345_02560 [Spartobacteria bacterium LR76]|nr:hypothetical protein DB345_02560 [Spartobacteria bacterium LR76]
MQAELMREFEFGTIGEKSKFYGYIVGLSIERGDLPDSPEVPDKMFARFEYGGKTTVYRVPDWELFSILAKHLCDNARMRNEHGDYGYAKLYIEKSSEGWLVDLP